MITRLLKCLNFAEFGGDMKAIQMHESLYTSQNHLLVYFMVNCSPIFSLLKMPFFNINAATHVKQMHPFY